MCDHNMVNDTVKREPELEWEQEPVPELELELEWEQEDTLFEESSHENTHKRLEGGVDLPISIPPDGVENLPSYYFKYPNIDLGGVGGVGGVTYNSGSLYALTDLPEYIPRECIPCSYIDSKAIRVDVKDYMLRSGNSEISRGINRDFIYGAHDFKRYLYTDILDNIYRKVNNSDGYVSKPSIAVHNMHVMDTSCWDFDIVVHYQDSELGGGVEGVGEVEFGGVGEGELGEGGVGVEGEGGEVGLGDGDCKTTTIGTSFTKTDDDYLVVLFKPGGTDGGVIKPSYAHLSLVNLLTDEFKSYLESISCNCWDEAMNETTDKTMAVKWRSQTEFDATMYDDGDELFDKELAECSVGLRKRYVVCNSTPGADGGGADCGVDDDEDGDEDDGDVCGAEYDEDGCEDGDEDGDEDCDEDGDEDSEGEIVTLDEFQHSVDGNIVFVFVIVVITHYLFYLICAYYL